MNRTKKALEYFNYKLFSNTAHSIHSPFVFDFVTNVLNDTNLYYSYKELNKLRKKLNTDSTEILFQDYGAGSKVFQKEKRKVSDILKYGTSTEKFSQLYFRIINRYNLQNGVELGTSIGINSAYLASANSKFKLFTIEACEDLLKFSGKLFNELKLENIKLVSGNFDDRLSEVISSLPYLDFFFIDGNHTYDSTLRYFELGLQKVIESSVFIFDDIRWSEGMHEAWKKIIEHPSVKISIDLFSVGIVFFTSTVRQKQHFVLRF